MEASYRIVHKTQFAKAYKTIANMLEKEDKTFLEKSLSQLDSWTLA